MITTLIKYENSTTISFNPINLSYNRYYQEFKAQTILDTSKRAVDFETNFDYQLTCNVYDIQGRSIKEGYYYPYALFNELGKLYKIILVPSKSKPLYSQFYTKINHLLYVKSNKTFSPFPDLKLVDNKPYREIKSNLEDLSKSLESLNKDTTYQKSNPNVDPNGNQSELAMTNRNNIFTGNNLFSGKITIGGIEIKGVALGKKNNTMLTTQGFVEDTVKDEIKKAKERMLPQKSIADTLENYIRFYKSPTTLIPRGYAVNEDGTGIADGSNGVSGIAPFEIKTTQETMVYKAYKVGYVYCAEDIPTGTEITFETTGKAIAYAGAGVKTGITISAGTTDNYCKIYTYNVASGTSDATDNRTYIVTGGNSSDSLDDGLVDYIALTQYKINGTSYEYSGGTNVAGAGISETNYKVWLGTDNNVHFGAIAPDDSIIIATYDTDASGNITRYEPLEQFAILSTVNRLVEGKNEMFTLSGDLTISPSGADLQVTWSSDIRLELPSISAGTAKYNTISAGNVILADSELAYITVDRNSNGAILTVNTIDTASADLTENDIVLFFNQNSDIFTPHIELLHNNIARLDKVNIFTENQTAPNFIGDLTGNADTSTALETARNIAGNSFDGTADITIASTDLTDTSNIAYLDAGNTFSSIQNYSGTPSFTNDNEIINKKYVDDNLGAITFNSLPDTQTFTSANSIYKVNNTGDGVVESLASINDTGSINIPTGQSYNINGTNINTGGTLTNVAYLDQANTFSADQTMSANLVVSGDLTVEGTTTTIDTTTLQVEDKNIEMGVVTTPTDITADGGGITLLGDTNKTIIWDNANNNWTSSEHFNIPTGKSYKINNIDINTGGTLTNVAYLDQANVFTALQTITDNSLRIENASNDVRSLLGLLPNDDGFLRLYDTTNTLTTQIRAEGDSYLLGGNFGIRTDAPEGLIHVYSETSEQAVKFERFKSIENGLITGLKIKGTTDLAINTDDLYGFGPVVEFSAEDSTGTENALGLIACQAKDTIDTGYFRYIPYKAGSPNMDGMFTINPDGYVGVSLATRDPSAELDVNGDVVISSDNNTSGIVDTTKNYFKVSNGTGGNALQLFQFSGDNTTEWNLGCYSTSVARLNFTNPSNQMDVSIDGKVGIGTTSPSAKLNVDAGTTVTTSYFITNSSDAAIIRLKNEENGNEWSWGVAGSSNTHTSGGHMYFYDEVSAFKAMDIAPGSGNAYFVGDVSAASFTDRTPYPKDLQTAIDAVNSMKRLPDGKYDEDNKEKQLDHSKLHPYLQVKGNKPNRNMSATISAQNEVIKHLLKEIEDIKKKINK